MKIRQGFISNSSSSSFVVKYRYTEKNKPTKLLTDEQVKKLKKFGFKYTTNDNPYFVGVNRDYDSRRIKDFKRHDRVNLHYDIICNQDDVIYFLLTNKIPFVALCHYEQELVVWDGQSNYFYETKNALQTIVKEKEIKIFDCGEDYQYFPAELCPPIITYKIDKWLEKEKQFMSSLV